MSPEVCCLFIGDLGRDDNAVTLRPGGTRPWGPWGKGFTSVSKGPKPPKQLLQLLKNSPREVKRAHFRYISGPPGPTQEINLMGPGGEGPSPLPGFSSHVKFTVLLLGWKTARAPDAAEVRRPAGHDPRRPDIT